MVSVKVSANRNFGLRRRKNNQRPEKMGNAAQDAGDREPGASGEGWVVAVGSPAVAVAMVFYDVHWAR